MARIYYRLIVLSCMRVGAGYCTVQDHRTGTTNADLTRFGPRPPWLLGKVSSEAAQKALTVLASPTVLPVA
jgi:hypothetical protein